MFWDRFYSLCIDNGTKPNPVCKELGFSSATATHWKSGQRPGADALNKIAHYFDVSVDYLLGKTDIKKGAALSEQPLTPMQEKALNMILSLPDSALEDLMRFLDALQKSDNQ